MKLYTVPRLLPVAYVRTTDQVAVDRSGKLITTATHYIDLDTRKTSGVRWAGVHASHPTAHGTAFWTLVHTAGTADELRPEGEVIVRESMEIDPWSYVKS
jgi:hypothetical protein